MQDVDWRENPTASLRSLERVVRRVTTESGKRGIHLELATIPRARVAPADPEPPNGYNDEHWNLSSGPNMAGNPREAKRDEEAHPDCEHEGDD